MLRKSLWNGCSARLTPNNTGKSKKFIFEWFSWSPFLLLNVIHFDHVKRLLIGADASNGNQLLSDSGNARCSSFRWHVWQTLPLLLGTDVNLQTIDGLTHGIAATNHVEVIVKLYRRAEHSLRRHGLVWLPLVVCCHGYGQTTQEMSKLKRNAKILVASQQFYIIGHIFIKLGKLILCIIKTHHLKLHHQLI